MDLSEYLINAFNPEKKSDLFDIFLPIIPDFVYLLDLEEAKITYLNEKIGVMAFYSPKEILSSDKNIFPLKNYENREDFFDKVIQLFKNTKEGDHQSFTIELLSKEGKKHIVRNRATLLKKNKNSSAGKIMVFAEDITEKTDKAVQQKQPQLNNTESLSSYGSWEWTLGNDYVLWSDGLFDIFGYDATLYPNSKMACGVYNQHIIDEDKERVRSLSKSAIANKQLYYEFKHGIIDQNNNQKLIGVKVKSFLNDKGEVISVLGTSEDITKKDAHKNTLEYKIEELKKAHDDLEKAESLFKEAESLMNYGSFDWDVKNNILLWSHGLKRLFSGGDISKLPEKITYEFYLSCLHENDLHWVKKMIEKSILTKTKYSFEYRLINLAGIEKTVHTQGWVTTNEKNELLKFIGYTVDITEMKAYEKDLKYKIEELNRSNQDLEQFAYIASHDLQEPLRKIMAFGERLHGKYGEQLGSEGQFYISKMMDAANRMKILMENLLSYSRVSSKTEPFELVDLGFVIESILSDFEMKIQDVEAQITIMPMPTLNALPTQMQQLFQNLISNALKFVKPNEKPKISIEAYEAERKEMSSLAVPFKHSKYYKIIISDNGIGFDKEYSEKIFLIFQRLHGRSEFNGTGIGLAICKKIADNHHGFIIAKGEPNKGAIFTVYLPAKELITPLNIA